MIALAKRDNDHVPAWPKVNQTVDMKQITDHSSPDDSLARRASEGGTA